MFDASGRRKALLRTIETHEIGKDGACLDMVLAECCFRNLQCAEKKILRTIDPSCR